MNSEREIGISIGRQGGMQACLIYLSGAKTARAMRIRLLALQYFIAPCGESISAVAARAGVSRPYFSKAVKSVRLYSKHLSRTALQSQADKQRVFSARVGAKGTVAPSQSVR